MYTALRFISCFAIGYFGALGLIELFHEKLEINIYASLLFTVIAAAIITFGISPFVSRMVEKEHEN